MAEDAFADPREMEARDKQSRRSPDWFPRIAFNAFALSHDTRMAPTSVKVEHTCLTSLALSTSLPGCPEYRGRSCNSTLCIHCYQLVRIL